MVWTFFSVGVSILILVLLVTCLCRCMRAAEASQFSHHTVVAAPMPQYQYPYPQQGTSPTAQPVIYSISNPSWQPSSSNVVIQSAYPIQGYGGVNPIGFTYPPNQQVDQPPPSYYDVAGPPKENIPLGRVSGNANPS